MARKDHMDTLGAVALTAFALHLAFNQVVIKVTNDGFGPVFQAGLRSFGAVLVLWLWMWTRSIPVRLPRNAMWGGVIAGILFGVEFICLYNALDLTTVSRASIIFYSMPVWLALAAHFVL
ncbi:MAG: EamA family transporter, partial [Pseudomonadota bacterium]